MADMSFGSISKRNKFESVMWMTKQGLLSIGVLTTLVLFKVAIIPFSFGVLSTLSGLYVSLRGWFSPPYAYIILNVIIITIAFSSTFQSQDRTNYPSSTSRPASYGSTSEKEQSNFVSRGLKSPKTTCPSHDTWQQEVTQEEEEDEVIKEVISIVSFEKSTDACQDFASSMGTTNSCLRCRNEEEQGRLKGPEEENPNDGSSRDSLAETWKLIKEGKRKLPTRQLKKIETWDLPPKVLSRAAGHVGDLEEEENGDPVAWAKKELRKSDTFNDSASLKREMSMSRDELNRRAEEFIKKFNLEMRLQRQK